VTISQNKVCHIENPQVPPAGFFVSFDGPMGYDGLETSLKKVCLAAAFAVAGGKT